MNWIPKKANIYVLIMFGHELLKLVRTVELDPRVHYVLDFPTMFIFFFVK